MVYEDFEKNAMHLGLTADNVEVNDGYVVFGKSGYEAIKRPFAYVASILHEYNPLKLACDLGILRNSYKGKDQD
jgi:hypothetical protein